MLWFQIRIIQHVGLFWLNLTVCGVPRGQTSTHFVDSDMQPIRKWGGESKIKTVMAQTESPCPSCLHDFSFCRFFSANSNPQTLATASSLSTMFVYSRVMFNSERSCEIPSSDMNECVFCVMCWLCHVAAHHTLRSNLLHLWFFFFLFPPYESVVSDFGSLLTILKSCSVNQALVVFMMWFVCCLILN